MLELQPTLLSQNLYCFCLGGTLIKPTFEGSLSLRQTLRMALMTPHLGTTRALRGSPKCDPESVAAVRLAPVHRPVSGGVSD